MARMHFAGAKAKCLIGEQDSTKSTGSNIQNRSKTMKSAAGDRREAPKSIRPTWDHRETWWTATLVSIG